MCLVGSCVFMEHSGAKCGVGCSGAALPFTVSQRIEQSNIGPAGVSFL